MKKLLNLNIPNDKIQEVSKAQVQKEKNTGTFKLPSDKRRYHNQQTLFQYSTERKSCTSQGKF